MNNRAVVPVGSGTPLLSEDPGVVLGTLLGSQQVVETEIEIASHLEGSRTKVRGASP